MADSLSSAPRDQRGTDPRIAPVRRYRSRLIPGCFGRSDRSAQQQHRFSGPARESHRRLQSKGTLTWWRPRTRPRTGGPPVAEVATSRFIRSEAVRSRAIPWPRTGRCRERTSRTVSVRARDASPDGSRLRRLARAQAGRSDPGSAGGAGGLQRRGPRRGAPPEDSPGRRSPPPVRIRTIGGGRVRRCRFHAVDGITGWGEDSRCLLNGWSGSRRPTMAALAPAPFGPTYSLPTAVADASRPRWARFHPMDEASCTRNGPRTAMICASPRHRHG